MRVATSFIALRTSADFQRAQLELYEAQRQMGSERKAADLKGFEKEASALISGRGLLERADSYVTMGTELLNRIYIQDVALARASATGSDFRLALTEAVGLGQGAEIMNQVELAFFNMVGSMETTYAGRYVFGGVRDDTSPINISNIDELEAAVSVDDIFSNAPRRPLVQVDPKTAIEVAPLANEVASDIFGVLKRFKEFVTANGPFSDPLSDAERTFIETEIGALDGINEGLNQQQSFNGGIYQRAEGLVGRQSDEREYYERVVGDIQTADLAKVASRISAAQLQLEASARVFSVLSQSSVLNFL